MHSSCVSSKTRVNAASVGRLGRIGSGGALLDLQVGVYLARHLAYERGREGADGGGAGGRICRCGPGNDLVLE